MEGPLEGADVSPDSQDPDADRRFAVCSFRNTHKEKKPAHQIQAMDPRPSTLAVGATQGDSLSKKPESLPEQRAANGAGDCQGSLLGGPPVQSEEPPFSEVESLLYPMSSHLSLTQSDNQGGGLIGDPGPGKARPAGVSPLSEMSSKLLEAGKGDWEIWEGNGAIWRWTLTFGRSLTLLRLKP